MLVEIDRNGNQTEAYLEVGGIPLPEKGVRNALSRLEQGPGMQTTGGKMTNPDDQAFPLQASDKQSGYS